MTVQPGRPHRAPHQVVRYAFALRTARELPVSARILEVGSGSEGISTWLRRSFVGIDLSFDRPVDSMMVPLIGDASRLPFCDGSFDLVLCIDVLQDVPAALIPGVCAEMARVTRGKLVITTPCGADAEASDSASEAWCRRRGMPPPSWLEQHVRTGLPRADVIRSALASSGVVREACATSVAWNERLFRLEFALRRLHAMTVLQPLLRAWGRRAPSELEGSGPCYRRRFVLDTQATGSPPPVHS